MRQGACRAIRCITGRDTGGRVATVHEAAIFRGVITRKSALADGRAATSTVATIATDREGAILTADTRLV
jgi:hypothetical protein